MTLIKRRKFLVDTTTPRSDSRMPGPTGRFELGPNMNNQTKTLCKTVAMNGINPAKVFENKKYITAIELAQFLGVSKKTVYGWAYRGLIQPKRIGPRLIRFDLREIEEWISQTKGDSHGNY